MEAPPFIAINLKSIWPGKVEYIRKIFFLIISIIYVLQNTPHRQDATKGHFLSEYKSVWIQSFSFL